uniref:Uncharacterized protein n=1 Tax=Lepeophtheirus salmonis TaxID=72036 RepID=A0A0K2UH37_LEPSM
MQIYFKHHVNGRLRRDFVKFSSSIRSKTSPNHDTSTTAFHCWNSVFKVEGLALLLANVPMLSSSSLWSLAYFSLAFKCLHLRSGAFLYTPPRNPFLCKTLCTVDHPTFLLL